MLIIYLRKMKTKTNKPNKDKVYTSTDLEKIIEDSGLLKKTVAEKLDISQAHLSKLLRKKVELSEKINKKIKLNLLIYKELNVKCKK